MKTYHFIIAFFISILLTSCSKDFDNSIIEGKWTLYKTDEYSNNSYEFNEINYIETIEFKEASESKGKFIYYSNKESSNVDEYEGTYSVKSHYDNSVDLEIERDQFNNSIFYNATTSVSILKIQSSNTDITKLYKK